MEELHRFRNKGSITKIDLRHAFHHIYIHPNSQHLAGFEFEGKFYKMVRMGFGFKNAVSQFQYCLDKTIGGIDNIRSYLDDTYILTENDDENLQVLAIAFNKLKLDGWKIRIDKCEFLAREVIQLGRRVNKNGIMVYQKHIQKIINFPEIYTKKQLQSFNGLINWLQMFIPDLHTIKKQLSKYIKSLLKQLDLLLKYRNVVV